MTKIDAAIRTIDKNICENIARVGDSDRGFLSQNILSQLRNFVEYIAVKICANGSDVESYDNEVIKEGIRFLKTCGNLRFLCQFHKLLQMSVSHYTIDEDGSERLMLKYYEYLLKIKHFLKREYELDVLENIGDFPLNTDTEQDEYYEKIAEKVNFPSAFVEILNNDIYYIQKIKPFFVKQQIFYEVTFTIAKDNVSKFDRVIAFTHQDLSGNYAVSLSIHRDCIDILEKTMNILVIDDWSTAIRPCEFNKIARIFGGIPKFSRSHVEYKKLMAFLTETKMSLSEFAETPDEYYQSVKSWIMNETKVLYIFDILDKCREIMIENKPGCNVLRYLLYKMNNVVIKSQCNGERCSNLSEMYLKYGCIPFDKMPYCTSLMDHNPRVYDLLECIPAEGREHEFFARHIQNNTKIKGMLFSPRSQIQGFENMDTLIDKYNSKVHPTIAYLQ